MKKLLLYRLVLIAFLSLFSQHLLAWDQSLELGLGYSHDPNNTKYNNYGLLLSSDLYPIKRNDWTFWSLNGALGQWRSTAPQNKNLTTAALALALRFYPFLIAHQYPSYLLGSGGPAILSSKKFGLNTQASNFTFQTNLGLGVEFNKIDVNLRFVHYSNADLGNPNEGFNILYLLSVGYLF